MAFIPIQQYKIAVSGSASAAQAVLEFADPIYNAKEIQAIVYAKGCDVVLKMGDDNTVAADPTATSNKLVVKNTMYPQGAIILIGEVHKYVSVISEDATSTGTLFMTVGFNEKI